MGTPAALAASQNERWGVYQFSQLVRKRQEKCWGYVIIGELDFQERLKSHDLEEQKEIGVLGYIQVSWVSKNVTVIPPRRTERNRGAWLYTGELDFQERLQ